MLQWFLNGRYGYIYGINHQKKNRFHAFLSFVAYFVPIVILGYLFYDKIHPFGYTKTIILEVGSFADTEGDFALKPSTSLSARKKTEQGVTYRDVNGYVQTIFHTDDVLKDATVTFSIEGDGVFFVDPQSQQTERKIPEFEWDFTSTIPSALFGDAFHFDDCTYFNGSSTLQLPDSADKFESGPFSITVGWKPEDSTNDYQEIIGHYNWEILQNHDAVIFQIGRMNNATTGPFSTIRYPVDSSFFSQKHTLTTKYSPGEHGYIELIVDTVNAGRSEIGTSTIAIDYNGTRNLSLGNAFYTGTPFKGCLYSASFFRQEHEPARSSALVERSISVSNTPTDISLPVIGYKATLRRITATITQKPIFSL
jgi:hypothetical protein